MNYNYDIFCFSCSKKGDEKMKNLFPNKEVFKENNDKLMKELFPDDED